MGHIQYDLQYNNLSILYKRGANPGFELIKKAFLLADFKTMSLASVRMTVNVFSCVGDKTNGASY